MKWIPFLISTAAACTLITVMNTRLTVGGAQTPRLGMFLSPQHGIWQNAAVDDEDYNAEISASGIQGKLTVYLDDRLVPHIFADREEDAYFAQGYLHAKFRLWQMEFQTHAAAGRLTEILGPGPDSAILQYDRQMRRLGMVYGAENTLQKMEADPDTKRICESYTAGVNAYIKSLTQAELPLEYKLLDYKPEPWSLKKIALFVKYMGYDLSGSENDFEMSNARAVFTQAEFDKLYPVFPDSLDPIVPKGTVFPSQRSLPTPPVTADSLYFNFQKPAGDGLLNKPDPDNGSNNWAVSGSKTASGAPILCNDPHLSLNLPSLWYEVQIHTNEYSAYGASFAGVPAVAIGYNDSCAWGFTNAMRDVRDYYEIKFKDDAQREYWFNNQWNPTQIRIEQHGMAGGGVFLDTVVYTEIGPVMYDRRFTGNRTGGSAASDNFQSGKSPGNYAVKWKAHDPTNEWKMFYELNKAKNYNDYLQAIQHLESIGQSCLFATKSGDIALWQQANFPAKWYRQGDFIMPGTDSSYFWQGFIPSNENLHQVNPERGFVSSANQLPADSAYPYYIGGHHDVFRGKLINRLLSDMNQVTPQQMMQLQNNNFNLFAATVVPLIQKYLPLQNLSPQEQQFAQQLFSWNLQHDPLEVGPTLFTILVDSLEEVIWSDELLNVQGKILWPEEITLFEHLLRDSTFDMIDDRRTPEVESISTQMLLAFKKAAQTFTALQKEGKLSWSKYKDSGIQHLLRLPALSRFHLTTGGGRNIINAIKQYHGPSWKMIVHLNEEMEAYGIYPGGQSGNPASKYYDQSVEDWAAGKYYRLWMMKPGQENDPRVRWIITFNPKNA